MRFPNSFKALAGTLVVAAAAAAVAAPMASADTTDLAVSAGSLGLSTVSVGSFQGITLSGAAQTSNATIAAYSVTDARGSGLGWNVTAQATQFAQHNGTAYVTGGKTLPTSSLKMAAPNVAANGTTSAAPSIVAGPHTLDGAGAIEIASAAVDTGMGTYDFTPGASSLTLSVPASAYAATYRSDVTISVVTGP